MLIPSYYAAAIVGLRAKLQEGEKIVFYDGTIPMIVKKNRIEILLGNLSRRFGRQAERHQ